MNFSTDLAQQLLNSSETFPVDFEEAWIWLGFKRKDNAKRSLLNAGFIENEDFRISAEPTTTGIQAHPIENIRLTVDCLKMWGMAAGTAKGKEIRKYFLECEKIAKQAIEASRTQPIQESTELLLVMPTEQELNYMRSRAWEKSELMGYPVNPDKIKQRTGYRRAIDIVKGLQAQAEQRAIVGAEEP